MKNSNHRAAASFETQSANESAPAAFHRIRGCLIGTAVADALGLPLEGMSRQRIARMRRAGELSHRFVFNRGMTSDDTEHACLVAQSLASTADLDHEDFGIDLARRLKWWAAGLPAGTGKATIKACAKLWLGWSYRTSGVWSAGNGPAMRAPIIAVVVADAARAKRLISISSLITHSDPKANDGALAIAALAHHAAHDENASMDPFLLASVCKNWIAPSRQETDECQELFRLIDAAANSASNQETTQEFAASQGWDHGVSGYTFHTVPAVIHSCMRYPDDYQQAVESLIRCGGDVDSTAALAGGILGARLGADSIPQSWRDGLLEWPRSIVWMGRLSDHVQSAWAERSGSISKLPTVNVFGLFARNLFFLAVVLVHAVRRLLPPY